MMLPVESRLYCKQGICSKRPDLSNWHEVETERNSEKHPCERATLRLFFMPKELNFKQDGTDVVIFG